MCGDVKCSTVDIFADVENVSKKLTFHVTASLDWNTKLVQHWGLALLHTNVAWTLSQCRSLPQLSQNIAGRLSLCLPPLLGSNIATTLTQCCLNVVSISYSCWGATLSQCSHNVAWMLSQFQSPTLGTNIATTFTQHWDNVNQCWYNIATRFSHNVVAML